MRSAALLAVLLLGSTALRAELHTVVLSGLGGTDEYAERFAEEADRLTQAATASAGPESRVIALKGDAATRERPSSRRSSTFKKPPRKTTPLRCS